MNGLPANHHTVGPTVRIERACSPSPFQVSSRIRSPVQSPVPSRARSPFPSPNWKQADAPSRRPTTVFRPQRVDASAAYSPAPAAVESPQPECPRVPTRTSLWQPVNAATTESLPRTSPFVWPQVDAPTSDALHKTLPRGFGSSSGLGGSLSMPLCTANRRVVSSTSSTQQVSTPKQRQVSSTQSTQQVSTPKQRQQVVAGATSTLSNRISLGQPSVSSGSFVPSVSERKSLEKVSSAKSSGSFVPPVSAEKEKESETRLEEIETQVSSDPNFSKELRMTRLAALGLDKADAKAFMDKAEFISLGTFCAISTTLQGLGVRRSAYPFDWIRSPLSGVVHLLNSQFEDFLTYTSSRKESNYHVFENTRWGGSFWHHDPEAEGTREEFTRRIERFYGIRGVPADSSRFFIRALNSSAELSELTMLLKSLKGCFPKATNYLLVLIDLQEAAGFYQIDECGENMLFYCVNKCVWETQPQVDVSNEGVRGVMDRAGTSYSEGIAKAIMWWCGKNGRLEGAQRPTRLARLDDLSARLSHFDAGCPSKDSFWPRRFRGQRIQLARPAGQADCNFEQSAGPGLLEPMPEQLADVCLPAGIKAGDFLETQAFGRPIKIQVPEGSSEGRYLRLRFYQGVVSCSLAALTATAAALTATTATAATAATAAATMATAATSLVPDGHPKGTDASEVLKDSNSQTV